MKKCLNCGTLCNDADVQCGNCQMPGRFRKIAVENPVLPQLPDQPGPKGNQCNNCGEALLEHAGYCTNCKMPANAFHSTSSAPPALIRTIDYQRHTG